MVGQLNGNYSIGLPVRFHLQKVTYDADKSDDKFSNYDTKVTF